MEPAEAGFRFISAGVTIPATVDYVVETRGSTTLGREGVTVGMVEHVLSAIFGLGVVGATIVVDGPEIPILDGSALPWAQATMDASSVTGAPGVPGGCVVSVELSARGGLDALGPRTASFDFGSGDYLAEVAWARTFVHAADVDRLLAQGMGAGATPENTLVVPAMGDPLPATRGPSEPARHKLLDLIGDLALLGRPLSGSISLVDSGHASHIALVHQLSLS